ncbi:MAG: hypothetical protein U5N53_10525 [Mycobacterium sp.]|nr:hypothetical protein [Mycobacterium sp.]
MTALSERLRITGFSGDAGARGLTDPAGISDQLSASAHREALLLGDSYAIVWADRFGRPSVTVESAKQVAVQTDPGSRQVLAAVKRWETKTTTEAVLYLPDEIVRLRANQRGAPREATRRWRCWRTRSVVVPVVNLRNTDRIVGGLGSARSKTLFPLWTLSIKSLADMLVTSEYITAPTLGHRNRTHRGTGARRRRQPGPRRG